MSIVGWSVVIEFSEMSMHGLRIHPLSNSVLPNHVPGAPPPPPPPPDTTLHLSFNTHFRTWSLYWWAESDVFGYRSTVKKTAQFPVYETFWVSNNTNKAIFLKLPVHKSPCHKLLKMLSQLVKHSCLEFHIVEILKGSYDVISSFSFSLECYKLIVDR